MKPECYDLPVQADLDISTGQIASLRKVPDILNQQLLKGPTSRIATGGCLRMQARGACILKKNRLLEAEGFHVRVRLRIHDLEGADKAGTLQEVRGQPVVVAHVHRIHQEVDAVHGSIGRGVDLEV